MFCTVVASGWSPVLTVHPPPPAFVPSQPDRSPRTGDDPASSRIRIFIAEDNDADIWIIRDILQQHGLPFDLTVASDGQQALRIIDNIDREPAAPVFDIALIDINLPRHTGHEVLARLRKCTRLERTPVVIVSSSESPRDVERSTQLGANAYFRKPAVLDEYMKLGSLVELLLRKPAGES